MNGFQRSIKGILAAVTVWLMAVGCATPTPTAQFILLPEADGGGGGLQVTANGKNIVLTKPYEKGVVTTARTLEVRHSSRDEVEALAGDAVRALPPLPVKYTLYFLIGSDRLTKESERVLETMLQALQTRPVPELTIIGHTDTLGDSRLNERLSLERAEIIKNSVIGLGVQPEQVVAAGRGERELLVKTPDEVREAKNRRVEIIIR